MLDWPIDARSCPALIILIDTGFQAKFVFWQIVWLRKIPSSTLPVVTGACRTGSHNCSGGRRGYWQAGINTWHWMTRCWASEWCLCHCCQCFLQYNFLWPSQFHCCHSTLCLQFNSLWCISCILGLGVVWAREVSLAMTFPLVKRLWAIVKLVMTVDFARAWI